MSGNTGTNILNLSAKHWSAHYNNCSGLVKAVAKDLGVNLIGQANDIMEAVKKRPWVKFKDGIEAKRKVTQDGYFVIAGTKGKKHGHVVIVVPGPVAHNKYPTAYWGNLGAKLDPGEGVNTTKKQYGTINYAWTKAKRDTVEYYGIKLNAKQASKYLNLLDKKFRTASSTAA